MANAVETRIQVSAERHYPAHEQWTVDYDDPNGWIKVFGDVNAEQQAQCIGIVYGDADATSVTFGQGTTTDDNPGSGITELLGPVELGANSGWAQPGNGAPIITTDKGNNLFFRCNAVMNRPVFHVRRK